MEIIPDPSHVVLLTLPFLFAAGGMWFILFQPLLAYLDERTEVSARARHEASELQGAAAEQLGKIEARLAQARLHVGALRQEARSRALAREAEIVAAARDKSEKRVDEALRELARDRSVASDALRNTATELSTQIAGQILGRPVA
jgi:F0F1-type ATP synthase membrane subunit b/b'